MSFVPVSDFNKKNKAASFDEAASFLLIYIYEICEVVWVFLVSWSIGYELWKGEPKIVYPTHLLV